MEALLARSLQRSPLLWRALSVASCDSCIESKFKPVLLTITAQAACSSRQQFSTSCSTAQQSAASQPLPVDTLSLMREFEGINMTRAQAEALTRHVTSIIIRQQQHFDATYMSRAQMDKFIMDLDSRNSVFCSEVLKSQEIHNQSVTKDTDRLQALLEKIKSEIRYEVDKLTASQRLDLNLEKGRMRDELQAMREKSNELEIRLDREINVLKAAVEQAKSDTIKWVLGILGGLAAASLAFARLVMQ